MSSRREGQIINVLMALCLIAGFACFSLIILPDQLKRVKAGGTKQPPSFTPQKLSSIIPLEQNVPKFKPAMNDQPVARFDPEPLPPPPGYMRAEDVEDVEAMEDSMPDVAGGAGAAIDNTSSEAHLAMKDAPHPPSLNEIEDKSPYL